MSIIQAILVIIIAFFAGMDGILDEFEFYQPLVTCTLIGLVTGNLTAGIILGGTLQMIVLGWANIGAAVAPDIAFASTASAIVLAMGNLGVKGVGTAVAMAVPFAVAGLVMNMIVRTICVGITHAMDKAAEEVSFKKMNMWQTVAIILQGLRVAIPCGLLLIIPTHTVQHMLNAIPSWLSAGMTIGGGMVVAVGYAMVINMMATKETWPFFIVGFVIAALTKLTLLAIGALAVAITLMYLNLDKKGGNGGNGGGNSNTGDPLGDILDDY